jgi:hypothetical protein
MVVMAAVPRLSYVAAGVPRESPRGLTKSGGLIRSTRVLCAGRSWWRSCSCCARWRVISSCRMVSGREVIALWVSLPAVVPTLDASGLPGTGTRIERMGESHPPTKNTSVIVRRTRTH